MRRTNLILDEEILAEAMRLTGERSQSAVVRRALEELVKRARARQLLDLAGSDVWDGDLAAMRGDAVHEGGPDDAPAEQRRRGRHGPR